MARTPIHPGEHLKEELDELGLPASELARQLHVPANRVTDILNGMRSITADTVLRLGHWFGTSADFWMTLQMLYDLRRAEAALAGTLAKLPHPLRQRYAARCKTLLLLMILHRSHSRPQLRPLR